MLKLRLLTGPRAGRQLRVSDTKAVSVGRRVGRLRLHDSRVSKNHASIGFTNGTWILRDLGSANGTYANRKRVDGLVELETGDVIQMGRVLIKILQADAVGMIDPTHNLLGDSTGVGIDVFSASGATNELPALDPLSPIDDAPADNEPDLASIFADDDDDAIDFSEQSRSDATRAPAEAEAGETLADPAFALQKSADQAPPAEPEPHQAPTAEADASDDPLLPDSDGPTDTADDLVAIEDETSDRDPRPGTTMLTAIDGTKPEIVGLRLDQQAPEQPAAQPELDPTNDPESAPAEPARSDAPDRSDAARETTATVPEEPDTDASDHAVVEAIEQETDDATDLAAKRAADASLTDSDASALAEQPPQLDLEVAHAELAFEDVLDLGTEALDPQAIEEELWPSVEPAEPAVEEHPPAVSEVQEPAIVEPEQDAVAEALSQPAETEPEPEQEAQPQAEQAEATSVEADADPDAEDGFDIDAAFDALTVGLDDSMVTKAIVDEPDAPAPIDSTDDVPAIDSEAVEPDDEAPQEHTAPAADAQAQTPADEPADPAELAESQLDISFIREALAKLEEPDSKAPVEPDAESLRAATQEEAASPDTGSDDTPGSSAAVADELDQDEQADTSELQTAPALADASDHAAAPLPQPPPGINPTSILPPTEPEHSYRPRRSKKNKWFYTGLVALVIVGLGAALVWSTFIMPTIAGKDPGDQSNRPSTAPDAAIPIPGVDKPSSPEANRPVVDDGGSQPSALGSDPTRLALDEALAGSSRTPDPFAEGPGVLGSRALAGMTQGNTGDIPLPETPDGRTRPVEIIQPTLPGSRPTNPAQDPGTSSPGVDRPGTVSPTPEPTPVAADTPARIVFLVDASGSLVDSLPQMVVWLNEAIDTIQPDERFTIIFFKASQAIEAEPAGLKQLTRDLRATLERDWLNPGSVPVLPAGRSDPSEAIERALRYNPTDLYLLSDESFARHAGDTTQSQAIALVVNAIGESSTRLHGVQFFYKDQDGVLETLANRYNGTYEFVAEDIVPETDPIDLLEELGQDE